MVRREEEGTGGSAEVEEEGRKLEGVGMEEEGIVRLVGDLDFVRGRRLLGLPLGGKRGSAVGLRDG